MAPRLELRHLQLITAVSQTGRITDAAELLGVTPSALSHRVREAERRLDVPLFIRNHKRLRMTPAAEYLASLSDRILSDLERAEDDVRRMNAGIQHIVRLSVETYNSYHWLPGFLKYQKKLTSGVDIQIMSGASKEPITSLLNRDIDIAVVSARNFKSVSYTHLFDDELLFIMPNDHKLVGKKWISARDMVDENFITFTKVPAPNQEFARFFRPAGYYPKWTVAVELPEVIVELVSAGQGISILAGWAVQSAEENNRVTTARLTADGLNLSWYAAIRKDDAKERGAIAAVASLLSKWCASKSGGFYKKAAA